MWIHPTIIITRGFEVYFGAAAQDGYGFNSFDWRGVFCSLLSIFVGLTIKTSNSMADQEKLYEVMGELLFAVAKADGVIQPEEEKELQALLQGHPWADAIRWSFDYEANRDASVEDVYKKVIAFCEMNGPSGAYVEFTQAMERIAAAADGIDLKEREMMTSFAKDLTTRFRKDLGIE